MDGPIHGFWCDFKMDLAPLNFGSYRIGVNFWQVVYENEPYTFGAMKLTRTLTLLAAFAMGYHKRQRGCMDAPMVIDVSKHLNSECTVYTDAVLLLNDKNTFHRILMKIWHIFLVALMLCYSLFESAKSFWKISILLIGDPSTVLVKQWCWNWRGGGALPRPKYLADQLTLLQPGGADSAHPLLLAPPIFFTFRHPG